MQHDTSDILSSQFKTTFNWSVDQEFSFIFKILKHHFSSEMLIKLIFSNAVWSDN
jgi:hypothetical protein